MVFEGKKFHIRRGVGTNLKFLNDRMNFLFNRVADDFVGKRVLDLGTHNGSFAYLSLVYGATYVCGVDINKTHLEYAKKNFSELDIPKEKYNFVYGDFTKNEIDPSYNIILCTNVLHYMDYREEVVAAIAKANPELLVLDCNFKRHNNQEEFLLMLTHYFNFEKIEYKNSLKFGCICRRKL